MMVIYDDVEAPLLLQLVADTIIVIMYLVLIMVQTVIKLIFCVSNNWS